MDTLGYAADESPHYMHPDDHPPPRGVKIALYTSGGIQTTGQWDDKTNYVAWAHLVKMDKKLYDRLVSENKMVGLVPRVKEDDANQVAD